ncbi:Uncharacterised protein [Halioglobus japonicus]|nr:Uncharacterised protein [Halioglobus japonicus]
MSEDKRETVAGQKPAETVRDKWNETFKERVDAPPIKFSWHSPTVSQFMRSNYMKGHSVGGYLKSYLGDRKLSRGVEIGGGLGAQAIAFYNMLNIDNFDVLDISNFAVQSGNERAAREGWNIEYRLCDLNHDMLPAATYDLIVANGSLHHIANLEHLFAQISQSLTPDGIFYANDYMGPNHMQWADTQLGIMNAIAEILPDSLSHVLHRDGKVDRDIRRIPLEIFAKYDPSEGVRSADIFHVMTKHLEIIEVVPFGQTIVYELLRGRIHNFDESDEKDRTILNLICLLEKTLLDQAVISSDFNLVIAKRKASN